MKKSIAMLIALAITFTAVPAQAEAMDETLGMNKRLNNVSAEKLILKDPMIAGLMSASLPGLGQVYTGNRGRGFLFFVGTIGAFGATAAFAHPADLDIADYDRVEYGGNGDGLMSVAELDNWEEGKFQDDAFEDLSTGRKVGAITSAATGLGLYIWNIIDARRGTREYNKGVVQRRVDLGMTMNENQTGLALNVHF